MAFERFEKPGERFSKKISIWKQGVVHLSKGTINAFALAGLDHCTLHYDPALKRVGFQFVSSSDVPGSVKLSYRDVGAVIPAKSFFDYYRISYNPSRQYILENDPGSGLLIIDLGAPLEEGYTEHPDGHNSEQSCAVLMGFLSTNHIDISPAGAGLIGRYLFEASVQFNWSEEEMQKALIELWSQAKQSGEFEKPRLPLEKKVFDLLHNLGT